VRGALLLLSHMSLWYSAYLGKCYVLMTWHLVKHKDSFTLPLKMLVARRILRFRSIASNTSHLPTICADMSLRSHPKSRIYTVYGNKPLRRKKLGERK
jgi:hypothetical protein